MNCMCSQRTSSLSLLISNVSSLRLNCTRGGSNFINSKTAAQLWQGVTPHDQKRHSGGKRLIRKAVKDLNFGRPVGTGKLGIQWPGLNAPVKIQHYNEELSHAFEKGSDSLVIPDSHGLTKDWMQYRKPLPVLTAGRNNKPIGNRENSSEPSNNLKHPRPSKEFKRSLSTMSYGRHWHFTPSRGVSQGGGGKEGKLSRFNYPRIDKPLGSLKELQAAQIEKFDAAERRIRKRSFHAPLSIRGWTSKSLGGLSVGAPKPVGDVGFQGFQTKILETKRVAVMKGRYGRCYKKWVLVVVGNYDGLIGYAFSRAETLPQAVKKAKVMAAKRLLFVERFNASTIFTDDTVHVDRTSVHLRRRQPGSGLRGSRVIREIAELAGLTDLFARIEGPTNTLKVVRATFEMLTRQRTYQQLADAKKLNVIMLRKDYPFYPILLAAPSDGLTLEGTNLPPEGELSEEELNQTVFNFEQKHDKLAKMKKYYGVEPRLSGFRRPGILNVPALRAARNKSNFESL